MSDTVLGQRSPDIERVLAGLKAIVENTVKEHGLVGVVAGAVHQGRTVASHAYGSARLDPAEDMTPATVVRIGSTTKTFTAIAVAQLWEAGRLDLDDPVERHLRSIRVRPRIGGGPLTIRQMLTHTSGLGEWRRRREAVARSIPFAIADGRPVPTLRRFYRGGLRADTPAGRRWTYANHAFAALGQLVEDVSGVPYADYVRERIFEPLDMRSSGVTLTDSLRSRLAQGYDLSSPERPKAVPYLHIVIAPAGSIHSSLEDMLRYAAWVSTCGETAPAVLRRETLTQMFQRQWEPDPRLPGQGLGFERDDLARYAVVGHDGGWPGFMTSFNVVPDQRFGVFVCTNALHLGARMIGERVLEEFLGVPEPAGRVPVPGTKDDRSSHHGLRGVYAPPRGFSSNGRWWNEHGGEVRISERGGRLVLSTPKGSYAGGVTLFPGDPDDDRFWIGAADRLGAPVLLRIRFERDTEGEIVGFTAGLPAHVSMRRRPFWRSSRFYRPALKWLGVSVAAAALAAIIRMSRTRGNARVFVRAGSKAKGS